MSIGHVVLDKNAFSYFRGPLPRVLLKKIDTSIPKEEDIHPSLRRFIALFKQVALSTDREILFGADDMYLTLSLPQTYTSPDDNGLIAFDVTCNSCRNSETPGSAVLLSIHSDNTNIPTIEELRVKLIQVIQQRIQKNRKGGPLRTLLESNLAVITEQAAKT